MKTLLTLTLLLLALTLHAGVTVYSAPDETGLVGYWKFDEISNVIDYSGNMNTGTNIGGFTLTNGVVGNALNILNGNSYVSFSNSTSNNVSGISNATLCVWMKSGNFGFCDTNNAAGNRFAIGIGVAAAYFTVENGVPSYPNCPVSTNVFTFFCMVVSNGTFTAYTNAVKATLTVGGAAPATKLSSSLPKFTIFSSSGFGTVDEGRLYNRSLSGTEITNLYNFRQINYLTNGTTPFKP